jgi:uncharacterized membrane protein YbhN (UPF0104 family)
MSKANLMKLLLTLAFIVAGVWFFAVKSEEFLVLKLPSRVAILIVALAFVTNVYFGSLYNVLVLRRLGIQITGRESFMLSSVTAAGNFILPLRAGAGLRALYLKKVYGFPVSHFTSTLAVYFLVTVLFAGIMGMLSVVYIYIDQGYFRLDLLLLFPALLAAIAITIVMRRGRGTGQRPRSWWNEFLAGCHHILARGDFVFIACLLVAASFVSATVGWTAALQDYAPEIELQESLLIAVSQILGGMATLTPGGTGFQELAGLYAGHHFQMSTVELLAVLVWTKVVRMIVAFFLALPSALFLKRRMSPAAETEQR